MREYFKIYIKNPFYYIKEFYLFTIGYPSKVIKWFKILRFKLSQPYFKTLTYCLNCNYKLKRDKMNITYCPKCGRIYCRG